MSGVYTVLNKEFGEKPKRACRRMQKQARKQARRRACYPLSLYLRRFFVPRVKAHFAKSEDLPRKPFTARTGSQKKKKAWYARKIKF